MKIHEIYNSKRQRALSVKAIAIGVLILASSIFINAGVTSIPSGWSNYYSKTGIQVFRKKNGSRYDYVVAVDMRSATLRSFTGEVSGPNFMSLVKQLSQDEFLKRAVKQNTSKKTAVIVLNGTFFDPNKNPGGIPFGLMSDWWIMSTGYDISGVYKGKIKQFLLDNSYGSSSIQSYDKRNFEIGVPNVIGGLAEDANKSKNDYLPRTFVGILDENKDTKSETVVFFSSPSSTQSNAVNVLGGFGAGSKMMLDGGGSTFLTVGTTKVISTSRSVPQAFVIYTGR